MYLQYFKWLKLRPKHFFFDKLAVHTFAPNFPTCFFKPKINGYILLDFILAKSLFQREKLRTDSASKS